MTTRGGCLCGALRYAIEAPPLWSAHCHCSLCRRAHGAAYVTWVGWPLEGFAWTRGEPQWFASSEQGERGFCGRCGATLAFRSGRWPGEIHLTRASLDGPLELAPQAHVSFENHVDWADLGDAVVRRAGFGDAS